MTECNQSAFELEGHFSRQVLARLACGLPLGYADLNDHEQLPQDPLTQVLAGKAEIEQEALAGKSTLNRLELGEGTPHR